MNTSKYLYYLKEYGLYLTLIVLGLGLMTVGGVRALAQTKTEQAPEFVSSVPSHEEQSPQTTVVVDVAGAVMSPGVYRLNYGCRVGEAIAAAGGLSEKADIDYVSRQVNLALVVSDGMKLYIPEVGTLGGASVEAGLSMISINQASRSELEELWGIGAARAEAIIEHRPYASIEELVSKANIPQSVVDKNQGKLGL